MALQNALGRISLTGSPSTAAMTTNITVLTMDVAEVLLGRNPDEVAKARARVRRTCPAIAGFLLSSIIGAVGEAVFGLPSLGLPSGVALVALALGVAASLAPRRTQPPIGQERPR
jgi:uncharacterized membrane protein YoaK (UPF0700 family)